MVELLQFNKRFPCPSSLVLTKTPTKDQAAHINDDELDKGYYEIFEKK
jgi:hypothetical protein